MKALLAGGGFVFLAVSAIAILTALGVGGTGLDCISTSDGGALAEAAPVPAAARVWIGTTKTACPDLPEPWIAA